MNIEIEEKLSLMQLSDSFFPTGMYAMSNGLEKIFLEKRIKTESEIFEFNKTMIEQQIASSECILLLRTYDSIANNNFEEIFHLDEEYCAFKTNKESREASIRIGRQLVKTIVEILQNDEKISWLEKSISNRKISGNHLIVFAFSCYCMNISKTDAMTMYLYNLVVTNVGAALRLGIIHHIEGQKIIQKLKNIISKTIKEYIQKNTSEIYQFCPELEIYQMQHQEIESKMFVT
ncbi:MAG: urease accessory protein UreF [Nitrosopumilus sp.]